MRRVLFGAVVSLAALGLSCSGAPYPGCCTPKVARNFGYVGSYATDGGVAQVQLVLNTAGEAQLTVMRDGDAVSQTFRAVLSP